MAEDDPSDRISALTAELAERQLELEQLRERLHVLEEESETLAPEPVLSIDGAGRVVASNGALEEWCDRAVVGALLAEVFEPADREAVERLAGSGWLGAAELSLTLIGGRRVSLTAVHDRDDVWVVGLHDITTRQVLDAAWDHRRRMHALSDLAGSIARELNDPMSIVQGRLELLLELGVTDPDATRRHLSVALEHARRISATLRNLRLVGRAAVPQLEALALDHVVEQALDLLGPRRTRVLVRLEPPEVEAGGDAAMVARVLSSQLRQVLDASPRGPVKLTARRRRDGVSVLVGHRRRGVEPVEAPADLTIDHTLLRSVGARLVVGEDGGWFEVLLPLPPARRSRARPVDGGLLVVGTPAFRRAVEELLEKDGFWFEGAADGPSALAVLQDEEGQLSAVITELFLERGMSGLSLGQVLIERHPELEGRVVLVSDTRLEHVPETVVAIQRPLQRAVLLEALGRRVRRR